MKKSRSKQDSSRPPSRPPQRNTASRRETTRRDPTSRAYQDSDHDRRVDSNGSRYRDSYNDRYNDRYSDRYSDRYNTTAYDDRHRDLYRQDPPRRRNSSSSSSSRPRKSQSRRRRFPISTVILLLVVVVLLILLMKSCISDTLGSGNYKLEFDSQTLAIGATTQAKVVGLPEGDDSIKVSFSSSDPSVASVDISSGLVTAHQLGKASIAATVNGKSISGTISVVENDGTAASVTLNYENLPLYVGDTFTLSATVTGSDSENPLIVWSSLDPSIAQVSNEGFVTAKSVGTTAISAKVGTQSDVCMVSVQAAPVTTDPNVDPSTGSNTPDPNAQPPAGDDGSSAPDGGGSDSGTTATPTSLILNETSVTLAVGSPHTLAATILPAEAASLTVTWESSNTDVVTVSKGSLLAMSAGSATVTAKVGEIEATCEVTVTDE